MVAPWWDDRNPIQNTSQNVFWAVTGAAPQRQLVIEWRNVSRASGCTDPTANVTFQVVFFEKAPPIFSLTMPILLLAGPRPAQQAITVLMPLSVFKL